MTRRIKILYILTACAIVGCLVMQAYWLYMSFEVSLQRAGEQLYADILENAEEYKEWRNDQLNKIPGRNSDSYNVDYIADDKGDGTHAATAKVSTVYLNANTLLGRPEDTPLTDDDKLRVSEILMSKPLMTDSDTLTSKTYNISNAPKQSEIMEALKLTRLEERHPFSVEEADSVFASNGLKCDFRLVPVDSMMWNPVVETRRSLLHPYMTVTYPYNILDCEAVEIGVMLPVSSVLRDMRWLLLASGGVSGLLILCLCWQIRTIVHQQRIDALRNNFVSAMIHELKRPIGTLKMCVSALCNPVLASKDADRNGITADMRSALDNLSGYFVKLRDVTFNRVDEIPLHKVPVDAAEALRSAAGEIREASGKEIDVTLEADGRCVLLCDALHLANILGNLLENAVKYSGRDVKLRLGCRTEGEWVRISVADNGYGIPAKELPMIFDKYFRCRNRGNLPGMGLGLTYVKLLVEAHGGSIEVHSREGEGSEFIINLPKGEI